MSALLRPMRRKHCVAGRVSRGTTAVFCAPIPNIRDLYVASDHVEVARETDLAVRVPAAELDMDQLRTVAGIARAVARQLWGDAPGEGASHGDAPTLH